MKNDFKFNTQACSINDLNPKCRQLWSIVSKSPQGG
jgi:hypothetical protein